ncbi:MAG: hypothetical protein Q9217_003390 [Psora testacea]
METRKTGYFQIFKWNVALQTLGQAGWKTFPLQKVISAQLLAMIEDQAVHKFIVHTGDLDNVKEALLLWVFTPDLTFSTSTSDMKRAMKLFYKIVTDPAKELGDNMMRTEELELPGGALEELQADLKKSTDILPPSARRHQDWTIGLLDR